MLKLISLLALVMILETCWSFSNKNMPHTNSRPMRLVKAVSILAMATIVVNNYGNEDVMTYVIAMIVLALCTTYHLYSVVRYRPTWPEDVSKWLLVNSMAAIVLKTVLVVMTGIYAFAQAQTVA